MKFNGTLAYTHTHTHARARLSDTFIEEFEWISSSLSLFSLCVVWIYTKNHKQKDEIISHSTHTHISRRIIFTASHKIKLKRTKPNNTKQSRNRLSAKMCVCAMPCDWFEKPKTAVNRIVFSVSNKKNYGDDAIAVVVAVTTAATISLNKCLLLVLCVRVCVHCTIL